MLNDEFLEKLFSDKRVEQVPLLYQSIMIHAVEDLLEKEGILQEEVEEEHANFNAYV